MLMEYQSIHLAYQRMHMGDDDDGDGNGNGHRGNAL